ncbi:MAG: Branched-chain-amino-acid aminotransferase [Alphaproteobacteria bacterium MarineAlpha10_Bin3]|jgi:branched-chain amino acid aminotransferase|nr:MAG: Branched-chain-amino-acid aminotransferase [Alphaproteobacteria bacterium MarineAlpha10_Bin3]PPR73391.1 MAG: Branched-chain-amino-acid aminotransferase [Alphaproteobacteria bacterium MarineAlpha4_Bin1]
MEMSYDDRPGQIWLDGALVPWGDANTHILTHALHYASCVFEGERAYGGRIFKLNEHTRRLFDGAGVMDMTIPYTIEGIDAACALVVHNQGISDGYVRPIVWRGAEMMGVSAQSTKIHVAIAAWEWPDYFTDRMTGIKMKWAKWRRPDPATIPCHTKAGGLYMICTLSKHDAEKDGFADALMLDYRGYIAEATGANIFMLLADGKLHTPEPDCFLDGITKRTVSALAEARGYEIVQRHIMPEELAGASEVFLTGTAVEVTPVREIGEYSFTPGDLTRTLMEDYDAEVRRAIPATQNAA